MATSAERELKILLSLVAGDLSGSAKVRAEMAALNADAQKSNDFVTRAASDRIAALQNEVRQQAAVVLQMERRVIMETQLEAAEAKLAGNNAMALKLEREAAIRAQALTIQRALNVSTEESIVLAERMVLAQEATAAASRSVGINMGKARTEAMVLGRELASGTVSMRTVSSLLGSLGSAVTIASIAGFELYHVISGQVEETKKLNEDFERFVTQLDTAAKEWDEMATRAESFADHVQLADKIKADLAKMEADMAAFRAKQLPLWQRFWDDIVTHNDNQFDVNGVLGKPNAGGEGPFQAEKNRRNLEQTNAELKKANEALDHSIASQERWNRLLADPRQGYAEVTAELEAAEAKLKELDDLRHREQTGEKGADALRAYRDQADLVARLTSEQEQLGDAIDKSNKKAISSAKEFNATLREANALIASIRQQQELIDQNPFLSVDEKQALTIAKTREELDALAEAISATKDQIEHSALDPAQLARAQSELQNLNFRLDQSRLRLAGLTNPLAANLMQWVNSFGNAAQQIGTVIEGTINAALQGTNQLLLDAVFRTGDWHQTLRGVERQILNLFVTWIEQQAAQFIAGEILKRTSTQSSVQSGAQIAAAHAPAAAATSISSYGWAAIVGEVLAVAAIGAIIAALTGGFRKGGYTGRRDDDEIAGVVHGNEFVFSSPAVDAIGSSKLDLLHRAALGESALPVEPTPIPGTGSSYLPGYTEGPLNDPYGYRFTGPVVTPANPFGGAVASGSQGRDPIVQINPPDGSGSPSIVASGNDPFVGFVPFGGYGGSPSLYPTTWSYDPQLGWVPKAAVVGGTPGDALVSGFFGPSSSSSTTTSSWSGRPYDPAAADAAAHLLSAWQEGSNRGALRIPDYRGPSPDEFDLDGNLIGLGGSSGWAARWAPVPSGARRLASDVVSRRGATSAITRDELHEAMRGIKITVENNFHEDLGKALQRHTESLATRRTFARIAR